MDIYDVYNTMVDMRGVRQLDEEDDLVKVVSSAEEDNWLNAVEALHMARRMQKHAAKYNLAHARLMTHIEKTLDGEVNTE